ncbi:MAG: carboxypeptidase regulatory-like domain-containing protein, partial [Candidatus Hydrogenedentes bacterium]|nr:carboxypeptidase regulatory-like domain-containing protein [Candidatus Hydrogenedentota bacterium]
PAPAESEIDEASGPAIAGTVIDTSDHPVSGVIVRGFGYPGIVVSDVTDSNGCYRLVGASGDEPYQLRATHEEYHPETRSDIAPGSSDVRIVLLHKTTLQGRVVRADSGEPIQEFDITCGEPIRNSGPAQLFQAMHNVANDKSRGDQVPGNPNAPNSKTGAIRRSDDSARPVSHADDPGGNFHITNLDAGIVTLVAKAAGFRQVRLDIENRPPRESIDDVVIKLAPAPIIDGTVVNTDEHPVAGASIYLDGIPSSLTPSLEDHVPRVAVTDENGKFRLESLEFIPHLIGATSPNYAPGAVELSDIATKPYVPVKIILARGGIISGRITLDGQPQSGWPVEVYCGTTPSHSTWRATHYSESDGQFRFDGLPQGEVCVVTQRRWKTPPWHKSIAHSKSGGSVSPFRSPDNTTQNWTDPNVTQDFVVKAFVENERETVVNFDITTAGAVLEGAVNFQGAPVTDLHYELLLENDSGSAYRTDLAYDGRYRIEGLPAGTGILRFTVYLPSGALMSKTFDIEVVSDAPSVKDFELSEGASISATFDGLKSTELAYVWVVADAAQLNIGDTYTPYEIEGRSDDEGRFILPGVPPGSYTLYAVRTPAADFPSGPTVTRSPYSRELIGRVHPSTSRSSAQTLQSAHIPGRLVHGPFEVPANEAVTLDLSF